MFTDSFTVERALVNGTSSSPLLLDLVICFKALQLKHSFKVEVFHVSGTQMIAQGMDGISCGSLNKGVMDRQAMFNFIPIHVGF